MNVIVRLLVLGNALLLALPPGWCCPAPQLPTPQKSAPKPPTCCHCCPRNEEPSESTSDPVPVAPLGLECCCEFDSTSPPQPKLLTFDWTLSGSVAVADGAQSDCETSLPEIDAVPVLSPPLHILQCVWLC